jgi:hypothetical protein
MECYGGWAWQRQRQRRERYGRYVGETEGAHTFLGVLLDEEPCEERTEDEGESSAMVAGGQRVGSSECVRACGRAGGERRAGVREAALWALGVLAGLLAVLVLAGVWVTCAREHP